MNFRKLFRIRPKLHLLNRKLAEQGYQISEAFEIAGKVYYQFDDAFKIPTGRWMCTLAFMEEFKMRASREYLEKHIKAVEIILSDPKRININALALIHNNLKERLTLVPFPDHIYKLASVQYFDENESPFAYDFEYNRKKIELWKKQGDVLDFFLKRLPTELMPFLDFAEENSKMFFQVSEEVNRKHLSDLSEILSRLQ